MCLSSVSSWSGSGDWCSVCCVMVWFECLCNVGDYVVSCSVVGMFDGLFECVGIGWVVVFDD